MANDRVFIKCDGCGSWTTLMKHMHAGLYTHDDEKLCAWLNEHGDCHPKAYAPDLDGNPGFSLHVESSNPCKDGGALEVDKHNAKPTPRPEPESLEAAQERARKEDAEAMLAIVSGAA